MKSLKKLIPLSLLALLVSGLCATSAYAHDNRYDGYRNNNYQQEWAARQNWDRKRIAKMKHKRMMRFNRAAWQRSQATPWNNGRFGGNSRFDRRVVWRPF